MLLLTLSAVYTFAAISGFVAFLMLGNHVSALWAGIAGLVSAINTHLRWLQYRSCIYEWYDSKELIPLARMGFVVFTIGTMGVVYHTTIEILSKKPLLPVSQSEVIRIVWAFMTLKSGVMLMYTSKSFCKGTADEICVNRNLQSI